MPRQNCELPSGYVPITQVLAGPDKVPSSVAGFVTDVMEPTVTRTGDYMITISLCDVDYNQSSGSWTGVKARLFRKFVSAFPKPNLGDIIFIKNIGKVIFGGNTMLSGSRTEFVLFNRDHIPDLAFSSQFQAGKNNIQSTYSHPSLAPSFDEQYYAMIMKSEYGEQVLQYTDLTQRPQPSIPMNRPELVNSGEYSTTASRPSADKFGLIKDIQVAKFYDMVVEVVKIFPVKFADYVEVYVTDYTSNRELYDYPTPEEMDRNGRDGDTFNYMDNSKRDWPGPWGQMVLALEIRYPHMGYIQQHVNERDFIELKNVRIKMSRSSRLEGNLWPDKLWPDKVLVDKVNPSRSDKGQALLERRDRYWAGRKTIDEARPQQADKANGKKKNKARKKAQERATAEQMAEDIPEVTGIECNKHVRSSNPGIPLSTIAKLLAFRGAFKVEGEEEELPFVNQKRRCQVRVVDFYPPQLEDFAAIAQNLSDGTNVSEDGMDIDSSDWEWNFFLLVEDSVRLKTTTKNREGQQTWLHVSNMDAQYLLDLDACDLRQDNRRLNDLRRKTDIIWGNLAELKTAAEAMPDFSKGEKDYWAGMLSNLPFDCCIQEHGQQLDDDDAAGGDDSDGWIRLFSLFETKVL
ncbi:hypothetical protein B9Z65_6825 [Elsinoe australis]|uniref:Protection of telomeres protein 1 n=1 Tax=Elsinoe australis TaxID=40998 RepID=A0A2P7Z3U2_9PEZI|nr:hypothetical protein B9Z65_6825 [Elsinoe australis]